MKFGIGLNANDPIPDVLAKGLEAERLGLDYVWVSDLPSQRYAPVVASAAALTTHKIRIGLGLISPFLHTPQQIASCLNTLIGSYGGRFELCIGPGDREQLRRVGVDLDALDNIPQHLLKAKKEISQALENRGLECRIWLGAQGSKLLKTAQSFDGVLLNYSSPEMIGWALEVTGKAQGGKPSLVGVFAPSYIYRTFKPEMYKLLQLSSATVAVEASNSVLRRFSLLEALGPARRELLSKPLDSSVLKLIPSEVVEKFSIFKSQDELPTYIGELERLGVEHVVFSYPQGYSIESLGELAEGLSRIRGTYTQVD